MIMLEYQQNVSAVSVLVSLINVPAVIISDRRLVPSLVTLELTVFEINVEMKLSENNVNHLLFSGTCLSSLCLMKKMVYNC